MNDDEIFTDDMYIDEDLDLPGPDPVVVEVAGPMPASRYLLIEARPGHRMTTLWTIGTKWDQCGLHYGKNAKKDNKSVYRPWRRAAVWESLAVEVSPVVDNNDCPGWVV